MFQTVNLECHQQCSFTLKMHQIIGGWGFAPDPTGGAYSTLPDPIAGLRGPTSTQRGG